MKKQQLLKDETPEQRAAILRNTCDKVEKEFSYMKDFLPQEIEDFKTGLSDVMIKVNSIEEKLQVIKDQFKLELKPLKKEIKELLTWIRDKKRTVTEECYINFEGEYAVHYNAEGEEIYRRPLLAAERQKTIFMDNRANGTDNSESF